MYELIGLIGAVCSILGFAVLVIDGIKGKVALKGDPDKNSED